MKEVLELPNKYFKATIVEVLQRTIIKTLAEKKN